MKLENTKTIILSILVITSVVLTYTIWSYQPNYEPMGNPDFVPEVQISNQKDLKQIVKPIQIFHHFEEVHFGTNHPGEIDNIIKELGRWDFSRFQTEVDLFSNVNDFLYKSGHTEIIFPEYVPMSIYRNILGIKEENLNNKFDRIIIDLNSLAGENGTVYFVQLDKSEVTKATVSASYLKSFEEKFYQSAQENSLFEKYSLEMLSEGKAIIVRTDPIHTFSYNYLIENIPAYVFKDALFRNPSFVKGNTTMNGAEYKDSSSLLSVHYDTNMILYVNPVQESYSKGDATSLLQKSIDFVNGHGGWTNNYLYVGMDELEKTVLFRMYTPSGFPIFNYNGMSEVLQIWGQTGIYQYSRNNFSLERMIESQKVELATGVQVIEYLKNQPNIEAEFIQNILIGYEMTKFSGDPLIQLEPAWFFQYKDQWSKVYLDNGGGLDLGLE